MTATVRGETETSGSAAGSQAAFACRMCSRVLTPKAWGGAECDRCGSVSAPPTRTAPEPGHVDSEDDFATAEAVSSRSHHAVLQAERRLSIVRRHVGEGLLVDVGGWPNPFANLAEQAGFDVTVLGNMLPPGLSPSIRFRDGGIGELDPLGRLEHVFDVVTAWDVLGHQPRPRLSVEVLCRLCRPGGLVFLTSPEVGTLFTLHSIGRSPWSAPLEHACLPSPMALAAAFESVGCKMVAWGRQEQDPLRLLTRKAFGLAEAVAGAAIRAALPRAWQSLRDSRNQAYRETVYFVLERS